jgi:hypothetical protein
VLVEPGDGRVVSEKWINQGGAVTNLVPRKRVSGGSIFIDFTYQLYLSTTPMTLNLIVDGPVKNPT